MEFIRANSFRQANRTKANIDRIVVHTAEITLTTGAAEAIAGFFSNESTEVSAHRCSDSNSVVQCVRDEDIAFHAKGDNDHTLGLEICTRAATTEEKWAEPEHQAALKLAAKTCAQWASKYDIPTRWLTAEQERRRERGFVTHKIVSDVFGDGVRSDPGKEFPYEQFMRLVRAEVARLSDDRKWRWELVAQKDKKTVVLVASAVVPSPQISEKLVEFSRRVKNRTETEAKAGRQPRIRCVQVT